MILTYYLFIILFAMLYSSSLIIANYGYIILTFIFLTLIILISKKQNRLLTNWALISSLYGISFFANNNSLILKKLTDINLILKGEIISSPSKTFNKLNFQLKISQYKILGLNQDILTNATGIFYIQVKNYNKNQLKKGDIIECSGQISRLNKKKNFDNFLLNKRIIAKFKVKPSSIKIITFTKKNIFRLYLDKFKNRLIYSIQKTSISQQYKTLILAVLFGEKKGLNYDIKHLFIRLNILHIFAISGLHFGLLGIIIQTLLSLTGVSKKTGNIISIFLLFSFLAMIEFPASAFRAWIMLSLYWLAPCLGRQNIPLNIISISGILLLLINPCYATDPGFILSYTAVLSIFIPGKRLHNFIICKIKKIKDNYKMDKTIIRQIYFLQKWVVSPVIYSFSIWIWTAPLIAYYFKIFSPISIITNYFAVYFLTIFLSLSLLTAFGGIFSPIIANAYAMIIKIILTLFLNILEMIESFSFSYIELPEFNIKMLGISYLILFSGYFLLSKISFIDKQNSKLINDN